MNLTFVTSRISAILDGVHLRLLVMAVRSGGGSGGVAIFVMIYRSRETSI